LPIVPAVSKAFPDHTIIVRPHPAELHETWVNAAEGLSNVKVVFEGTVSPWLLAADAVLHWGCTTGLEAFLMGKPVVAYNPITAEEEKFDHKLPHSISVVARTPEETIKALRHVMERPANILEDFPAVGEGNNGLKEWMHTPDGGIAAKEIIRRIGALDIGKASLKPVRQASALSLKEGVWRAIEYVANITGTDKFYPARIKFGLQHRAYGRQKTKNIIAEELQEATSKMAALCHEKDIRALPFGKNLFYIGRNAGNH
jgi:hypothetical protein